jgi:hypothetical protein
MRWSLFVRDFASRPVDAPPCGPLRRGLALHFPALARQQDGARHFMLAAGVIRHLPPRQPERFGRIQSVHELRSCWLGLIGTAGYKQNRTLQHPLTPRLPETHLARATLRNKVCLKS